MDALRRGQRVGAYVVDSLLGHGSETEVYLVQHDDGTFWCLKLLLDRHPTRVDRLRREGLLRMGFDHPHIVPAKEIVEAAEYPALIMDFVEGPTLRQWLNGGPAEPAVAWGIMLGMTQAVAAAHEEGVIHRDLRPENILMQPTSSGGLLPRVADWGLARWHEFDRFGGLTTVERRLGSAAYAAPEQLRDATSATPASDVFALGCIFYELLVGKSPFAGHSEPSAAKAMATRDYVLLAKPCPDVPADWVELVDGMLSPMPNDRPHDATALWHALRALNAPNATRSPWTWLGLALTPAAAALLIGVLVVGS